MIEHLNLLRAAYQDGKIDRDNPLIIDNDDTYVYDASGKRFEMHPSDLLVEALDLLGIPNEPA